MAHNRHPHKYFRLLLARAENKSVPVIKVRKQLKASLWISQPSILMTQAMWAYHQGETLLIARLYNFGFEVSVFFLLQCFCLKSVEDLITKGSNNTHTCLRLGF